MRKMLYLRGLGISWMLLGLASAGCAGSGVALILMRDPTWAPRLLGAVGFGLAAREAMGKLEDRPMPGTWAAWLPIVAVLPDLLTFGQLSPVTGSGIALISAAAAFTLVTQLMSATTAR